MRRGCFGTGEWRKHRTIIQPACPDDRGCKDPECKNMHGLTCIGPECNHATITCAGYDPQTKRKVTG